jgi:hypothetical protein
MSASSFLRSRKKNLHHDYVSQDLLGSQKHLELVYGRSLRRCYKYLAGPVSFLLPAATTTLCSENFWAIDTVSYSKQ